MRITLRLAPASLALAILSTDAARSEEWPIYGARAMGMGGAGVAVSRGGTSVYWNPAALARGATREITPLRKEGEDPRLPPRREQAVVWNASFNFADVLASPGETLEAIDNLVADLKAINLSAVRAKLDAGTPLTEYELRLGLRIVGEDLPALDHGEGLLLDAAGGPALQVWRFGLALVGTGYAGAKATVDLDHLALGDQGITSVIGPGQDRSSQLSSSGQSLADQFAAGGSVSQNQAEEIVYQAEAAGLNTADPSVRSSLESVLNATAANSGGTASNSITENRSGVELRGVFLQELAFAYGQPIGERFAVGASVKAMHAYTYSRSYTLSDLPASNRILRDLANLKETEESFNVGVDAGALFTPFRRVALGICGKNLNRPSFSQASGKDFILEPNLRAGAALYPVSWLTLAADIDCTRNGSNILPGHRSQVIGGGGQIDLGLLALRAGVSKNLLDSDEDLLLHMGMALRIWYFSLEAAAMVTPTLHGFTIHDVGSFPERAGVSLSMGFNIAF